MVALEEENKATQDRLLALEDRMVDHEDRLNSLGEQGVVGEGSEEAPYRLTGSQDYVTPPEGRRSPVNREMITSGAIEHQERGVVTSQ